MRFLSSRAVAHCAAQAVLCLLAFNAHAATHDHDAPPAPSADVRLSLQASASAEIPTDTVRITLATETEDADQTVVSKQLASVLDAVAKQAQGAAGISSHTGNYGVWPNRDNAGKINGWHGRGEIVLESKDFAAASALATRLNDKVAISNVAFFLSREARQAEEHKLLTQAAQAFQARALDAAKAFGFSGYRIVQLDLDGAGVMPPMPHPMPMMRMAAKQEDPIDAPLEGGNVVVNVSVSGAVVLH